MQLQKKQNLIYYVSRLVFNLLFKNVEVSKHLRSVHLSKAFLVTHGEKSNGCLCVTGCTARGRTNDQWLL